MIYLRLLEIAVIITIIIDISGVIESLKSFVSRMLGIKNVALKPLECSFCLNFWASMVYLIWVGELNLTTVMVTLLISTLTPIIQDVIYLIRDIIGFILHKINQIIK